METAKEFFDEFLDMREDLPELVFDKSSSKVYKVDSDTLHQMNLRLYDSNDSNYFEIKINVSLLKEDDSGEEIERMWIHISKDGKDKGGIYLRMYNWSNYYSIYKDKIKDIICDIWKKYGTDSDFIDFACDLIKIIHNHCLGI